MDDSVLIVRRERKEKEYATCEREKESEYNEKERKKERDKLGEKIK